MMNKIEFIIAFRHANWVTYQIAVGQPYNEEINNDQFDALKDGVEYQLHNPDTTSEESHQNWMAEKRFQGWTYGPVKDFDKKTHPNLVDFVDLPDVEKMKDIISITAHRMAVKMWDEM
jgi:hypothetical protein